MYNSSLHVEVPAPRSHESLSPSPQDSRSKNARAQARHREKRKAYIRQLEDTLARLQTAMSMTGDRIETIPSSLARLRELERENHRLRSEVQSLRRHVTECLYSHAPHNAHSRESGGVRKRRRSHDYTGIRTTATFALEESALISDHGDDMLEQNMPDRSAFHAFTPSNESSTSSSHSTPSTVPESFCAPIVYVANGSPPQTHYSDFAAPHNDAPINNEQAYTYNHDSAVFPKQECSEERLQPSISHESTPSAQYCHDSRPYEPNSSALCHGPYPGWAVHSAERRSVLHCV